MRCLYAILAAHAAALLVGACANPSATLKSIAYGDPTQPYLGMSKQEIIACAGQPHSDYSMGSAGETLTYHYSGAGPVPGEAKKSNDKKDGDKKKGGLLGGAAKDDKEWTCTASFVFQNDRLVKINFAHKGVRSPYQYESEKDPKKAQQMKEEGVPTCSFTLPRCPKG